MIRWWGESERQLPTNEFRTVLLEQRDADGEHPSVSLEHGSGWALSYYGGKLIFENVEEDEVPWRREDVSIDEVAELWARLATGDVEAVRRAGPWLRGYNG